MPTSQLGKMHFTGMRTKKVITTTIKVLVTLGLLYYVFQKIDFKNVLSLLGKSDFRYLFVALFFFLLSQWFSAVRLLRYFQVHQYDLSRKSNYILHLVGMFYNFFIPGGVGGDAYKVYLLNKHFKWNIKNLGLAALNNRLSGLVAIAVIAQVLILFLFSEKLLYVLIPIGIICSFLVFYLFQRRFSPQYLSIFYPSLLLSFCIQIAQIVAVFFILQSFAHTENFIIYSFVFLVSSVLSVVSFAGIGLREWLFMKAAELYQYQSEIAVAIALLFSIITIIVSLLGVFFVFTPQKWLRSQSKTH